MAIVKNITVNYSVNNFEYCLNLSQISQYLDRFFICKNKKQLSNLCLLDKRKLILQELLLSIA